MLVEQYVESRKRRHDVISTSTAEAAIREGAPELADFRKSLSDNCGNRVQKSHTKVSFFVPTTLQPTVIRTLPTTLAAFSPTFAALSVGPQCRRQFPWGSWKLFELSGSRGSPNCGCSWTK